MRCSGRAFEALAAAVHRRRTAALYHSALVVTVPDGRYAIEMAPVPDGHGNSRGAVAQGAVGSRSLGRLRVFRYEIRRWRNGVIPDLGAAVGGPVIVSNDPHLAHRLVELVASVPTPVWGRDELRAGEMWNSNAVTSWLLASAGVDPAAHRPPPGGRAPGWDAGLAVAAHRAGEKATAPSGRMAAPGR